MRGRHRTSVAHNHILTEAEEHLRAREEQTDDPSQPEQTPECRSLQMFSGEAEEPPDRSSTQSNPG